MKKWAYEEFWWFIHNMIAHPASQILHMLGWIIPGCERLSGWVHDVTIPEHEPGTGHG